MSSGPCQSGAGEDEAASAVGRIPIVALGASAGGLEAFQEFFRHAEEPMGCGFVLIQHLDRTHETLIPELLSKYTRLPVRKAEDGDSIGADEVFVIPPNQSLFIDRGRLRLGPLLENRHTVDEFFRSLAEDQADRAVAVVLSGTGDDGTLGLRAVKECGGLTFAQAPETARYDGMPLSAISTGWVDHVLPIAEMPGKIREYLENLRSFRERHPRGALDHATLENLPTIWRILRAQTGHDFSRYKHNTLFRRVQRRMQVTAQVTIPGYIEFLRIHNDEVQNLFKDLLIGVTHFFRDPDSFEALSEQALPTLLNKKPGETIRCWVPGCATGEEAYSLAILLDEALRAEGEGVTAQVFATDLDEQALSVARTARYSQQIAGDVSAERLDRYFRPVGTMFEVVEPIRRMCVFSQHNVIKDPPFSRLDLISCRNLLIYLQPEVQRNLLAIFHYGLNPSGFLFLGPSENISSRSELFRSVDSKHRIFARKPAILPSSVRVPILQSSRTLRPAIGQGGGTLYPREQTLTRTIERVLIEEFTPASVIINDQGEVVYFSGRADRYLKPATGVPSNKLVNMARRPVRAEIRSALTRALSTRSEVARRNLKVASAEGTHFINLLVRPLNEVGKEASLFIVVFEELTAASDPLAAVSGTNDGDDPLVKQLDNELRTAREDLQTTIEELETSNEELKSANEELVSMNEELQSANEELQTSKEEIQSVNDELQRKIEEVDQAHREVNRTIERVGDGFASLDLRWNVTYLNGAAREMMARLGRDADRLLGQSLWGAFPEVRETETYQRFHRAIDSQTPTQFETYFPGADIWATFRLYPSSDGLSVFFRDITAQRKSESALAEVEIRYQQVFEHSSDAIFLVDDASETIVEMNSRARELLGLNGTGTREQLSDLAPKDPNPLRSFFRESVDAGRVWRDDLTLAHKSGSDVPVELSASSTSFRGRRTVIAIARDISDRLRAEQERVRLLERESEARDQAETLNRLALTLGAELEHKALVQKVTDAGTSLTGAAFGAYFYNVINEKGESFLLYTLSGAPREAFEKYGLPRNTAVFEPTFRGQGIVRSDDITKDPRFGKNAPHFGMPKGHLPVRSYLAVPVTLRSGEVIGGLFFGHPQPDRFCPRSEALAAGIAAQAAVAIENARLVERVQRGAEQLRQQLAWTKTITESLGEGLMTVDTNGRIMSLNVSGARLLGYEPDELLGHVAAEILAPAERGLFFRFTRALEHAETVHSDEESFACKDGSTCPIACTASPIMHEGKVMGGALVFRDITERKRAEEQLRERARLDAFVVEIARHLNASDDLGESLRRCTQAFVDRVGAAFARIWTFNEKEEVLELQASAGLYTHINGAHGRIPLGQFKIGQIASERTPHLTNSVLGDPRVPEQAWAKREGLVSFAGYPLVIEDRLIGVVAMFARHHLSVETLRFMESVVNLISVGIERKRSEQEVRVSEDRFRCLVSAISQIVWVTNAEGMVEAESPTWMSFTGQSLEAFRGMGWLDAVHVEDRNRAEAAWRRSVANRTNYEVEYRVRRRDGVYRWTMARGVPVFNGNGTIREWVGTNTDVTASKEAERLLEQMVEERTATLREIIGELEAFSYSVSHDLRSPLRAIEGYARALQEDCGDSLDDEQRNYLDRIIRSAARLDRLTLDVLAYSRVSRADFQPHAVDLDKLVHDIVDQYPQFQQTAGAITIRENLERVLGHEAFLTQSVSNLLGNAIKFVPNGRVPEVAVWTERRGATIRLWVEDNGIGIAPEHRDRVFQIFGRIHHDRSFEGTGIGLAVVKKAVEKMGGTVGFESMLGKGSRFYIELPAVGGENGL